MRHQEVIQARAAKEVPVIPNPPILGVPQKMSMSQFMPTAGSAKPTNPTPPTAVKTVESPPPPPITQPEAKPEPQPAQPQTPLPKPCPEGRGTQVLRFTSKGVDVSIDVDVPLLGKQTLTKTMTVDELNAVLLNTPMCLAYVRKQTDANGKLMAYDYSVSLCTPYPTAASVKRMAQHEEDEPNVISEPEHQTPRGERAKVIKYIPSDATPCGDFTSFVMNYKYNLFQTDTRFYAIRAGDERADRVLYTMEKKKVSIIEDWLRRHPGMHEFRGLNRRINAETGADIGDSALWLGVYIIHSKGLLGTKMGEGPSGKLRVTLIYPKGAP